MSNLLASVEWRRKRLAILIAVGVLLATFGWLGKHVPSRIFSTEPEYEGHPLSYWLQHWSATNYGTQVNGDAVAALRALGTNSLPSLVKWIGTPTRSSVEMNYCSRALQAFKILGPEASPAIPDLIQIIGQNGNFPACALAYIGTNAIPALTNRLLQTVTATNKVAAAQPRSFVRGRRGADFYEQENLLGALSGMGTNAEAALPALVAYVKSNNARNPGEATGALGIIGRNHPAEVIPVLAEVLASSGGYVRASAADALGSFGTNALPAIRTLVAASHDLDPNVRIRVAVAIKQIAPETPDALMPLIQSLSSHDTFVREQALWALATLGTNGIEALPALAKCLHDRNPEVRIEAERCLQRVKAFSDDIILRLQDNLSHSNYSVSTEAVSTLGLFADRSKAAFMALVGAMNSSDKEVRQQSKYRLTDSAKHDATYLVQCLNDSDPLVRVRALLILYDVGQPVPDSVPVLVRLVRDESPSVRDLAHKVLWLQDQETAKSLGLKSPW